jgi:hypothetical protein
LLTTHDGFQKVAEGAVAQLVIGGDGGVGVEEELAPHRNAVARSGLFE